MGFAPRPIKGQWAMALSFAKSVGTLCPGATWICSGLHPGYAQEMELYRVQGLDNAPFRSNIIKITKRGDEGFIVSWHSESKPMCSLQNKNIQ